MHRQRCNGAVVSLEELDCFVFVVIVHMDASIGIAGD
jgi:hypothetical protein